MVKLQYVSVPTLLSATVAVSRSFSFDQWYQQAANLSVLDNVKRKDFQVRLHVTSVGAFSSSWYCIFLYTLTRGLQNVSVYNVLQILNILCLPSVRWRRQGLILCPHARLQLNWRFIKDKSQAARYWCWGRECMWGWGGGGGVAAVASRNMQHTAIYSEWVRDCNRSQCLLSASYLSYNDRHNSS